MLSNDLFADAVVFRQSLWLISCSDISSVAINLHLISCHTNKWPLQMGHCVSWVVLCSLPQHVLWKERNTQGGSARERERDRGGVENRYRKSIRKSPLSFISSVIVKCDKLAPSYLKPLARPNGSSCGERGNEMGFTTELTFGAAILPTTS